MAIFLFLYSESIFGSVPVQLRVRAYGQMRRFFSCLNVLTLSTNFWNCLIFIQSNNIDCSFSRLKFNENVLQELRVYSFIHCTPSLPLKIKFCCRYLHLSLTELFTDVHRLLNNLLFNSADQGNNSRSMLNNLERRPEVNL